MSRRRPEAVARETLWKRAHLDSAFGLEIAMYMYFLYLYFLFQVAKKGGWRWSHRFCCLRKLVALFFLHKRLSISNEQHPKIISIRSNKYKNELVLVLVLVLK